MSAVEYYEVIPQTCRVPPSQSSNQCRELFENKMKIILATDNDAPGEALAEELSRRLGKERCWRVRWPSKRADLDPAGASSSSLSRSVDVLPPEGSHNPNMLALTVTEATVHSSAAHKVEGVGASPSSDSTATGADKDDGFRKDANEVLVKDGPDRLRELIEQAEPTPINGLYRFRYVRLYRGVGGLG